MKNRFLRRSPWLAFFAVAILLAMLAPVVILATVYMPATAATAPSSGSPVVLGCLALGMIGFRLANPTNDNGDQNGGGDAEDKIDAKAALAQVEDRTLSMGERLGVAIKALRGLGEETQLAALTDQLTTAKTDLAAKIEELTQAQADLSTATARIAALEKDVSDLDKAKAALEKEKADLLAKEQDLQKRADQLSKEHLKSLGHPAENLPGTSSPNSGKTEKESAEDQIRELKGQDRVRAALEYKETGALPAWVEGALKRQRIADGNKAD